MNVYTYYRRGKWLTFAAESSPGALDMLRAEVGSVWFDWQLASVADLTFDNLPAQKAV